MKKLGKLLLYTSLAFMVYVGFFGFIVSADSDKTALTTAYNEVQAIITLQDTTPLDPYYEEASYQAFSDAITALGGTAGIQAMIDDPLATQLDVDNMTSDINTAIAGLITSDTYNSTHANFFIAKAIDMDLYTSDSQTLYNSEMDRIEAILDNPTAGDQAIADLNDDIDLAADLLVLRGDKTTLLDIKNQVETIYIGDGSGYIPSSFIAFQDSYEDIDNVLMVDIGMTLQQLIDDIDAIVEEISIAEDRLNEVLAVLIDAPDKTTLINDYADAMSINWILYTSASSFEFAQGLSNISAIINDVEATQSEVNQALIDLAALYDVLILKADLTALEAAYDAAIALDLTIYTPDSATEYLDELERINEIISANDSTQEEADQALIDLGLSVNLLILKADRSELLILNQLVIKAYYENKILYTDSSYLQFTTAVNAYGSYLYVNSVIANDNVSQSTVDNLASILSDALGLLDLLIDNTELLLVHMNYSNLDLSEYTQNSQDLYNAELDRLYAIITGKELNADAALQVLIDFQTIPDLLVLLPDFSELIVLYDSSNIYRNEDYSISSYGALETAKANAMSVIENNNADEDMVAQAVALLEDAITNLSRKAETIYIFEEQTLDVNQYVTLGQATVIRYYTDDASILGVDNQGVITGIAFGKTKVYIELSNGYIEILDIHVKAKVNTTVYVLAFTLPVTSVGIGAAMIYIRKDTWVQLWKIISSIFKKK